jgi:predicted  nucleic acid-binding Zn-ribbon protein
MRNKTVAVDDETDRSSRPSDVERRRRMLNDAIERIRVNSPGFSAMDNLSREELYDRDRARSEAQMAAGPQDSR